MDLCERDGADQAAGDGGQVVAGVHERLVGVAGDPLARQEAADGDRHRQEDDHQGAPGREGLAGQRRRQHHRGNKGHGHVRRLDRITHVSYYLPQAQSGVQADQGHQHYGGQNIDGVRNRGRRA